MKEAGNHNYAIMRLILTTKRYTKCLTLIFADVKNIFIKVKILQTLLQISCCIFYCPISPVKMNPGVNKKNLLL